MSMAKDKICEFRSTQFSKLLDINVLYSHRLIIYFLGSQEESSSSVNSSSQIDLPNQHNVLACDKLAQ